MGDNIRNVEKHIGSENTIDGRCRTERIKIYGTKKRQTRQKEEQSIDEEIESTRRGLHSKAARGFIPLKMIEIDIPRSPAIIARTSKFAS